MCNFFKLFYDDSLPSELQRRFLPYESTNVRNVGQLFQFTNFCNDKASVPIVKLARSEPGQSNLGNQTWAIEFEFYLSNERFCQSNEGYQPSVSLPRVVGR